MLCFFSYGTSFPERETVQLFTLTFCSSVRAPFRFLTNAEGVLGRRTSDYPYERQSPRDPSLHVPCPQRGETVLTILIEDLLYCPPGPCLLERHDTCTHKGDHPERAPYKENLLGVSLVRSSFIRVS